MSVMPPIGRPRRELRGFDLRHARRRDDQRPACLHARRIPDAHRGHRGSGELGTHVLRRLAADDTATELRCVDIRPPLVLSPKLRFVHADVRDRAALERAFDGCDAVLHFAFIVTRKLPRDIFWGINVDGSKNAFEAAAAAGVKSVVYTSSVAQYGVVSGHPFPSWRTRRGAPSRSFPTPRRSRRSRCGSTGSRPHTRA